MNTAFLAVALLAAQPVVVVDRDNVIITESCILRFIDQPIPDADKNGVVSINSTGDAIEVTCEGRLVGSLCNEPPNEYTGTGIRITGPNVRLYRAEVSGYKVGIHATAADGLDIAFADVSDNFRQRLKSTPEAEDASDWLWPHANDNNEWITNYGAGICVEDSERVILRRCRARDVQNGLILDSVNHAKIYDNDFSFLSGWGIALWRSSDNEISRNALDFCVRGYSHGKYNRGQDSAGLLMFEQCCRNKVVENSMTHCGDGVFAFAGKEALGEINPRENLDWYKDRGNSENLFARNDLSYCAAHGLELTFSSGNRIHQNRIVGNAICGIWGGYSRSTTIQRNEITDNGDAGYGEERGGINIEHGVDNQFYLNEIKKNTCGIFLWWDEDDGLAKLPWAKANDVRSVENRIVSNTLTNNDVAIQLRQTKNTMIADNTIRQLGKSIDADEASERTIVDRRGDLRFQMPEFLAVPPHRDSPVGKRDELNGRANIIMTEWGPYDWRRPLVRRVETRFDKSDSLTLVYEILSGEGAMNGLTVTSAPIGSEDTKPIAIAALLGAKAIMTVPMLRPGVHRVEFQWMDEKGRAQSYHEDFAYLNWKIRWFNSPCDPREDIETWRAAAEIVRPFKMAQLHASYGNHGPQIEGVGSDHFGTIAEATIPLAPGEWRIRTISDDGLRVWMNETLVIDDWTWHGPTKHDYEFELDDRAQVKLRVEHFELDGFAVLSVDLEPVEN